MRHTEIINGGWRFHAGEAVNASYRGYDDRAWKKVTLPHDWSVHEPFDVENSSGTGYLPGGIGWYRKHFTLPEGVEDQRVFVTFLGVYKHARVYVNSHYLGMRAYGYSSFTYELTGRVQAGDNVLCVRAEHIELADSRWFTGAGIYRDVILTVTPKNHIANVFAQTVCADENEAVIRVTAEADKGGFTSTLTDAGGNTVASGSETLTVPSPKLWSPDSPYLYTLTVTLEDGGDSVSIPFGIRTFRFDRDRGFFLNGKRMLLKGVCMHHDMGVLGAAVPAAAWEYRLKKLKAADVNAFRASHNPPDPNLLDLCDKMGFFVMDEAFDEWEGCKNKWWQGHNVYPPKRYGYADDFPQNYEQDLSDMVKRDRNHPSIILWSIGNEIDYPNDPYVNAAFKTMTGNNDANKPAAERLYDPNRPDASRLVDVAKTLTAIVHKNDLSRPVTMALAFPELSNLTGLSDIPDVDGYNYKENLYDGDHEAYEKRIILGSENSHSPEAWRAVLDRPYIAGQFLWTGADFLGEARGWPIRISQAGMIDIANHEKPLYYARKAMWTDELSCALGVSGTGSVWDEAFMWEGVPGEEKQVACHTNAEKATLYLNGKQIAEADVKDWTARFAIPFEPGELKAVCVRGDETAEDTLFTAGKAARLNAKKAVDADLSIIEVVLEDEAGHPVPTENGLLKAQILGDAVLAGIENGDPADLTSFESDERPLYRGKAVVYVKKSVRPSLIRLTCANGLSADLTV